MCQQVAEGCQVGSGYRGDKTTFQKPTADELAKKWHMDGICPKSVSWAERLYRQMYGDKELQKDS